MIFFVSRQCYWPDGDCVVEIAQGGLDYANPNMLVTSYDDLGEGKEYHDPREALRAAIRIRDAWNTHVAEADARVEIGFTHGMTIPFEEYPTEQELWEVVSNLVKACPICDECGAKIFDDPFTVGCEGTYCSDSCRQDALERSVRASDDELLETIAGDEPDGVYHAISWEIEEGGW